MSPLLRRLWLALLPALGPALGLAVLVAVLAAAVVSAPQFTEAVGQAAWENRRDTLAPASLGGTLTGTTLERSEVPDATRLGLVPRLDKAVTAAGTDLGLPDPVLTTLLRQTVTAVAAGGTDEIQLVSREEADENVQVVAGESSPDGVLVPELLAERTGVGPGDHLAVQSRFGTASLRVDGVYAVPTDPMPDYWDGQGFLFRSVLDEGGNLVSPPSAVLASQELAVSTGSALGQDLTASWYFPAPLGGVEHARARAADFEALRVQISDPAAPVAALLDFGDLDPLVARTVLPDVLDQVDRTVELLEPPVRAVGVGGGAAAVVLVGAWAALRARRRGDELRLLVARGTAPVRAAGAATVEAVLPVLVGLAAGAGLGVLVVDVAGPAAAPPDVNRDVVLLAGAAGAAALAVVAAVTAAHTARLERPEGGLAAHVAGRVPWLAVTAAVTVVAAIPLITAGPGTGSGVGTAVLAVPLLATVVVAGVVLRLLAAAGRRADPLLRRLPTGAFLAVRRVLAGPASVQLVVTTTALALGLVVYATALADSTSRTAAVKGAVATGADVVVPLGPGNRLAGDGPLPDGAMEVGDEESAELRPDGGRVDVLVVRPDRVPRVVDWNDALADRPLDTLMALLANYDGDRVPVLAAGPLSEDLLTASDGELVLDFRYFVVPVQVVGTADAFPGQDGRAPMLVADWDAWTSVLAESGRDTDSQLAREVWARGDAAAVLLGLRSAGYGPFEDEDVVTARAFAERPEVRAQTWALSYLAAVSLAGGALGLVGVAMFAVAQQRRRTVAAVLLGRMGMRRRSADATAGLELGLLTGLAAVVAVAVGLPASALVLRVLDPVPALPPAPLFAVPAGGLLAVLAGVTVVTAVGAALVGRTARRTTGGQVMRDAD